MTKMLKIENLNYKKNRQQILADINLTIDSGKIVALLGENGAGKTTLMRLIAGVAKHYQGKIELTNSENLAQRKTKISFTDGLTGFSDSNKIQDVVNFYKNVFSDFNESEFEDIRKFMKLAPDLKLGQLSRGMKEKLIIALTFARQADLYLLDEPFGGIDPMARKKIINSIILWKNENSTILISDHFVNQISSLLDEVVVIKNHTVFDHQSAEDIRAKHQSIEEYYEGLYEGEDE